MSDGPAPLLRPTVSALLDRATAIGERREQRRSPVEQDVAFIVKNCSRERQAQLMRLVNGGIQAHQMGLVNGGIA